MSGSAPCVVPPVSFRDLVRKNVVALLIAGNTLAGSNVQSNRVDDTSTDDMPFIGVYIDHETKSLKSDTGTDTMCDATLTINVVVLAAGLRQPQLETDLDTLIDQVQAALLTSAAFWMPQPNGSRWISRASRIEVTSEVKGDAKAYVGRGLVAIDVEYTDLFRTVIPDTFETLTIAIDPFTPLPACPPPPVPVTVTITLDQPPEIATT